MKRLIRILVVSLLCLATAFGMTACAGADAGKDAKEGVVCRKFGDDGFYTVTHYYDKEGVTSLDLNAAVKAAYGEDAVVGRIKAGAFSGSSLTELVISDSGDENVSLTIDEGALNGMKALEKLTVPFVGAKAKADAFFNETEPAKDKAVNAERCFGYVFGATESEYSSAITFNYGSSTASYYIPVRLAEITVKAESEYSIPMYAFNGLTQVSKIKLEGNIVAIGDYAFYGMKQLTNIVIADAVAVIGESAFEGTDALKTFGENGFYLSATSGLIRIKDKAFKGTVLTDFVLPQGVTVIGDECFANSSLKTFTFNAGLVKIGNYAFYGSSDLTVELPQGVEIGIQAFGNTNLIA